MNTFPLVRTKWSNEHVMAALFFVLILYHLPQWIENPVNIIYFVVSVIVGLSLDAIVNYYRYHRLWCSVSAAVTSAIINLLTAKIPLWGKLLGIVVALIIGKHIWGGTGKNLVNPAMVGLLVVLMLFDLPYPVFPATNLLIPAIMLSIPFLMIRPAASIGFLFGMSVILSVRQELSIEGLMVNGAFFFGFVVLTDPVTVTGKRTVGYRLGFLAGFAVLFIKQGLLTTVVIILAVNLVSALLDYMLKGSVHQLKSKLRIPKQFPYDNDMMIDLTGDRKVHSEDERSVSDQSINDRVDTADLQSEDILNRIKSSELYGMGGAAFSTEQKIRTVLTVESEKYLIINGVECDPGLIHDYWLQRNKSYEIQMGIEFLCRCVGFKSIHLAVKEKEGLIYKEDIQLHQVPDCYPVGAEKLLISEILHKKFTSDQIPAECGILVLNVQTVYAISEAVRFDKKVDTRYLTVANLKTKSAHVVKVKLGSKVQEVMEAIYPGAVNIFVGGGLMQSYPADDDMVVDKRVNFIATGGFPKYKESPQCSRCGMCSLHCPVGLQVNCIADLVDQNKLQEAKKYHADQCIGCGSCSYSCLAGRNLASRVRRAKDVINASSCEFI